MNTQNQDYIIDHVGAENWNQVVEMFNGKTQGQIKSELDQMFTSDDNTELAQQITNELS